MRCIELLQPIFCKKPKYALVDDKDYHWLVQFNWHLYTNPVQYTSYAVTKINGKRILMHQLLLLSPSKDLTPDHKDRNGLNNQRNNLRLATQSQQQQNKAKHKSDTTSKYKGVFWASNMGMWRAAISKDKRKHDLGFFKTEIEAAEAYNRSAKKLHGEFAVLNQIEPVN